RRDRVTGGWMGRRDREPLAVLLSVSGLGPLTLGRRVDRLGSPAAILETAAGAGGAAVLVEDSRAADGEWRAMPRAVAAAITDAANDRSRLLAQIERNGLRVVARGDAEYPSRLLEIELPPPALFVRGSLAALAT